eukprot:m.152921 g.152921  ORF g.152921 m.152921 type:complete len:52 (+) comp14274_c0_seq6:1579-1734(+)
MTKCVVKHHKPYFVGDCISPFILLPDSPQMDVCLYARCRSSCGIAYHLLGV